MFVFNRVEVEGLLMILHWNDCLPTLQRQSKIHKLYLSHTWFRGWTGSSICCVALGFSGVPLRSSSVFLGFSSAPLGLNSAPLGLNGAPLGLNGVFLGCGRAGRKTVCFGVTHQLTLLG